MPSSVISRIEYDHVNQVMKITFVSGFIYQYENVPEEIFRAFKSSGAKGIYFNRYIKPNYRAQRIDA